MSNRIKKCYSPVIEEFIESAFNQCILDRTYPAEFRTAKVPALLKEINNSTPKQIDQSVYRSL